MFSCIIAWRPTEERGQADKFEKQLTQFCTKLSYIGKTAYHVLIRHLTNSLNRSKVSVVMDDYMKNGEPEAA